MFTAAASGVAALLSYGAAGAIRTGECLASVTAPISFPGSGEEDVRFSSTHRLSVPAWRLEIRVQREKFG